ncbi:MAG: hypothetical protein MJE77_34460 [Proteobacteria bacterium]|nr:hypothetical protein [Pseudomonadota bacterium]
MHFFGLVLITLGFIGGALYAVLDKESIDWWWFSSFAVLGAAGVGMVQLAIQRAASDETLTEANVQALRTSLGRIVSNLAVLDGEKNSIDVYDLPQRIDHEFRDDILSFVDARESIVHVYSIHAYADVMSHFAAAERYLNRVWSCAADGYIDEAHEYINRSHKQFTEAQARLEALAGG